MTIIPVIVVMIRFTSFADLVGLLSLVQGTLVREFRYLLLVAHH